MRHAVGILFGPAKNKNGIEIGALQQGHEQVKLLLGRDWINSVGDGFGR